MLEIASPPNEWYQAPRNVGAYPTNYMGPGCLSLFGTHSTKFQTAPKHKFTCSVQIWLDWDYKGMMCVIILDASSADFWRLGSRVQDLWVQGRIRVWSIGRFKSRTRQRYHVVLPSLPTGLVSAKKGH